MKKRTVRVRAPGAGITPGPHRHGAFAIMHHY
jgi:hypothetical protein